MVYIQSFVDMTENCVKEKEQKICLPDIMLTLTNDIKNLCELCISTNIKQLQHKSILLHCKIKYIDVFV